jgi:hypothetical protein
MIRRVRDDAAEWSSETCDVNDQQGILAPPHASLTVDLRRCWMAGRGTRPG